MKVNVEAPQKKAPKNTRKECKTFSVLNALDGCVGGCSEGKSRETTFSLSSESLFHVLMPPSSGIFSVFFTTQ